MNYTTEIINFIQKNDLLPILNESPFYKLNPQLRRQNICFTLTDEEKKDLQEIKRTNDLPCRIKLENGDYGKFVIRGYQKEILDNMVLDRFMFVNHSRQMGISVSIALHLLKKYGLTNSELKNQGVLLVSNKLSQVKEMINKIKNMYMSLPFFMKAGIVKWNDKSIEFDNGNHISYMDGKTDPSVGFDIDCLVMYDCKYIGNRFEKKFYKNIIPTVIARNNSQVFIFESGDLSKNIFLKKLFLDKNMYKKYQYHWTLIHNRNESWVKNEIVMIGEDSFKKEYELVK